MPRLRPRVVLLLPHLLCSQVLGALCAPESLRSAALRNSTNFLLRPCLLPPCRPRQGLLLGLSLLKSDPLPRNKCCLWPHPTQYCALDTGIRVRLVSCHSFIFHSTATVSYSYVTDTPGTVTDRQSLPHGIFICPADRTHNYTELQAPSYVSKGHSLGSSFMLGYNGVQGGPPPNMPLWHIILN